MRLRVLGRIIKYDRSVVVACDVWTLGELKRLVEQTSDVERIGGYKIGSVLAIRYGLPRLVQAVRELTDLPIIYDHQKAMTDIPALGESFARAVKEAGADALIGFPQSGPATQEAWIEACKRAGLEAIIGGEMTHPRYKRSEGGYIADEALEEIYLLAARLGVTNFVVPGNKADRVKRYREILQPIVGEALAFYAPGLITQGGRISDVARAAGNNWHAIVGRAIYGAKDVRAAAKEAASKLK